MKVDKEEIRLYFEDRNGDGRPKMLIERYINKTRVFSAFVSASMENGVYDKIQAKGDDEADPAFDAQDDVFYVHLANAAVKLFN
ncbi:hypothetical protein NVV94_00445 [Pseudomonas sp. LS1212]|uniref:hypothetical protein n=1 Tax=Pseudomonas sp. LS1212 TaxID=2972478 RepID=UPI00215C9787|nr:hypothetical protein [Pseudomonas sp. LS1212]UVJ44131.1 hypothetical protein NVV94_00445 [Pseudomonas sp. LS1212]